VIATTLQSAATDLLIRGDMQAFGVRVGSRPKKPKEEHDGPNTPDDEEAADETNPAAKANS
jgi:hypothetical protein